MTTCRSLLNIKVSGKGHMFFLSVGNKRIRLGALAAGVFL